MKAGQRFIGVELLLEQLGLRLEGFRGLAFLSMAFTLVALVTLPMVAISAKNLVGHGLYERVNTFASAIWTAIFAVVLLRRKAYS